MRNIAVNVDRSRKRSAAGGNYYVMSKFRMRHPNSTLERMNLLRDIRGRGVFDIATQHHGEVDLPQICIYSKEPLHAAVCKAVCWLTNENGSSNHPSGVKSKALSLAANRWTDVWLMRNIC